jgi:hypothetical protein
MPLEYIKPLEECYVNCYVERLQLFTSYVLQLCCSLFYGLSQFIGLNNHLPSSIFSRMYPLGRRFSIGAASA